MDEVNSIQFLKNLTPEQAQTLTMPQLDNIHQLCVKARKLYDDAKEISDECHREMKELQAAFCSILENLGRTSYKSEHGTFSYSYRDNYSIEDKDTFFNYLKEHYGQEGFESLATVNYQTLNSWAKNLVDHDPEIIIPGLVVTTSEPVASMRK
jgi:hypothetical protein